MPEGDTVFLACKRLHQALAGQPVTASDFRVPQLATADLSGATVLEVVPRGKHQLLRFSPADRDADGEPLTLHTHFKMDGTWHLYRPGATRKGGPDFQVRVVLTTPDWEAVGYRLPVVELIPTAQEHTVVGHLGPDLLGPDWDLDEALRRLGSAPERTIGEALLDQRNLAGIGTLYRAETLFLSGIHPRTPVAAVPDLRAVVERARRLLEANKDRPDQSTTGDLRRGRTAWVFERARQPCRRCGTRIREEAFGPRGQERKAYWCPRCQPQKVAEPSRSVTGDHGPSLRP
ncbi:Fpg/Nei family DNA glycosylase [Sporichthya polymorpha]|uniref:Fpg/Nei family DNA glycosylase n=1 Tax=Sporichthya polymorpha TaxID=35751 RepID=UPI000369F7A2|nr:DNA-formamidopyrimidine glycosylase family protein [Sporichthya polymorpha]